MLIYLLNYLYSFIYDLTPFTPSEALRASTVARAAADPDILIFFNPVEPEASAKHASTVARAVADPDILIFFNPVEPLILRIKKIN